MIKVKNLGEERLEFVKLGAAVSATTDLDNLCVPYDCTLKAILAVFGTMGTDGTGSPTQDVIVDLMKNGVSIFGAGTKITWAHAGQLGTANTPTLASSYATPTVNPTPLKKGDCLRLDGVQILNGTSPTQPTDLTVHLVLVRKEASPPAATLLGQVDEND